MAEKSFVNISLAIKESLRIENGAQYTHYQVNNSIKNQICSEINHNTCLWTDCTIRCLNGTKTHVAATIRHKKQTDMQNNQHLQAFSITASFWGLKL